MNLPTRDSPVAFGWFETEILQLSVRLGSFPSKIKNFWRSCKQIGAEEGALKLETCDVRKWLFGTKIKWQNHWRAQRKISDFEWVPWPSELQHNFLKTLRLFTKIMRRPERYREIPKRGIREESMIVNGLRDPKWRISRAKSVADPLRMDGSSGDDPTTDNSV